MSPKFKYDIGTLIELVEARPCLWDKFSDAFKDKILKKNAWNEVFAFLESRFVELETGEQEKISDEITTKWQNIRDSFVRSLEKKSGQAMQLKYVYHDQLQFLLKVVTKDETISSISDTEIGDVEQEFEIPISPENTPTTSEGSSQLSLVSKKHSNRKRMAERMADPIESEILKRLKESSVPVDEDESFFNSMVPTVKKMSDDEKLEFRMGVPQLIQKIKLKRPISSPSYLDSSNSSSVCQFPAVAAPQYNLDANQQARTYESFYPKESYTVSNNRSPEDSQKLELL